jgi:hypothetical protein
MDVAGTHVSDKMRQYAAPLLEEEVPLPIAPDGLPRFARLQRRPGPRKLAPLVGRKV